MRAGDRAARDALFAAVYQELKRLAHSRLYGGGRNTVLDTTALVHESYLRLVQTGELSFDDRRAFFGYASRVMRSVIVDSARARLAERRGGDRPRSSRLSASPRRTWRSTTNTSCRCMRRCEQLEQADARAAQMVEMRYFGGYTDQRDRRDARTSPSARCSATGRRPGCCCE